VIAVMQARCYRRGFARAAGEEPRLVHSCCFCRVAAPRRAPRPGSDDQEGGMASKLKIKVNGLVHSVTASLDTPLLYVLHNELHLHGPRFGCGLAQCGACSVLLDGKEIRSCVTPVAAVSGKAVTTLEGLPAMWAKERGTAAASPALHPLQQAWIDVQVPHCGYCQNGMMIQAADLLSTTKNPTEDQIRTAMNGH